jgi:hypothetical protein
MRFQKLFEQLYSKFKAQAGRKKSRGQSLVELALFLPILLIILSGLIEFGFGLNQYINVVEATREGARFGVDGDPGNEPFKNDPARAVRDLVDNGSGFLISDTTCGDDPTTPTVEEATRDYYAQIACIVQRAADPIDLNEINSDIIVTVVRTYRNAQCDVPPPAPTPTPDPNGPECQTEILPDPYGLWPYMITQVPSGMSSTSPGDPTVAGRWQLFNSGKTTQFDRTRIQNYLATTPIRSQASAGVLIVETFYDYEMLLKLPWITQFVPDPISFYTYTIVPLPAAEPRPTPTPTFTPSPTFTPTPIPNPVLRINAGGPTFGSWQQDTGSGGTSAVGVIWTTDAGAPLTSANPINTSLAPNAGIMEVYQSARTSASAFTYTIDNLVPSQPYLVRLHFSENWNAGRAFSASVNGTPWWPNQTVASVAGGMFTAHILDVDTSADSIGRITIQFSAGAIINGIEIVGDAPAGDCPGDPVQSNWALGQITSQSSIPIAVPALPVTLSCRAVDGNTDGVFNNGSVTRTSSNAQAWWQVDLGQTRTIYEVRLWNTTDAADIARGTDFYVVLSDVEAFSLAAAQALQATGNAWVYHAAGEMNAGAGPTRIWVGGQDWRYVKVILAGTNALHLAEVEVSGDPLTACGAFDITNFAQGQPAMVSRLGNNPCFAADGGTVAASAGSARADGSLYNVGGNFEQGFWQVDLGSQQSVGRVTLYAATDAPGVEQTNLWVLLSTDPFTSTNLAETLAQPGVTAINNPGVVSTAGTNFDTASFTPVPARYIRVQRGDSASGNFLTLAEVRVEASAPTPTPTLTPTPICLPGVVDPLTSRIQIQGSPTWSDNVSLLTLQVFLLDNCGVGITDDRPVTLQTSRSVSDTITAPNPNAVQLAPGTGIYQFTVRSTTVGTSAFTATVGSLLGGTGPIVAVTGATNQGQFVCLTGTQAQGSNPKQLAINYANPSQPSVNRRLVQLQVSWQTVSGTAISNSLTSVSLGNSSNVIWTGSGNTPVNIGVADWTSVFRTIASSASRNLLLDFANQVSPPVGSQWRYTVIATWDNGFNASYCNSLPVVITLP